MSVDLPGAEEVPAEPTVALDSMEGVAGQYLRMRDLRTEMAALKKEYERLEAAVQEAVGDNHVATLFGEPVITYRPTKAFQGKKFAAEQPILTKEYTRPVVQNVLNVAELQKDHPEIYRRYQSRTFKVLDVA